MLMKIFGLTNKSNRMSAKNIFFSWMLLYLVFFSVFVVTYDILNVQYCNWTSKISLYV